MDTVIREDKTCALPAGIRFVDLVDVAALQALMDSFHKVIGIANAIIDLDGVVIAQAGWQDLCTRFHRVNAQTRRRCVESDTSLAGSMTRGEHFAAYRCLNGLVDTASPVIVGGCHMANVFTGQFFVAPPELDFFRRQAREFGFDESAYLEAVARVPVMSPERVEAVTGVYAQFAQILAANGMDRLRQLTAERELEEANRRLELRTRQLEAANKELEDFSYSMSHDMRTPLRAIDGFAKILADEHGAQLDAEGKRLLGVVRDNARRMGRLIDDILRFLRVGRRKMEDGVVDMARLARDAFEELRAGAPTRRLRLELCALPPASGDYEMLRLVMLNLLANALKFSPADRETVIEVGGAAEVEQNTYYVRDRGVGFDMQYVDKLFKVFERVHATGQYEGSGIGLAIVKRIVERHGGRVWAEGRVGAGATFHFALPHKGE
ncbi:MAG: PocR ligand-binding domain-containing protein [Rhodocyclaceae bacterium]|nr:PocR ligand-binding domain-containing protein [Rhodocyclaceae bacterium]